MITLLVCNVYFLQGVIASDVTADSLSTKMGKWVMGGSRNSLIWYND